MTKHEPPEHFKPQPYSYVINHGCIGEVRPYGDMFSAVAVFPGFAIWLGTYIDRQDACRAVIEAHGGGAD